MGKGRVINLTGQHFGRLTVIERVFPNYTSGSARWLCSCSCGNTTTILSGDLKSGNTKSCGCLARENSLKHGNTRGGRTTPEYFIWSTMIQRCHNPNNSKFEYYGGRGIIVCDEWRGPGGFEKFLAYIGPRPSSELELDRIDNDGNYAPENVRWTTHKEQMNNTRQSKIKRKLLEQLKEL